jgi:hypothetical protein
MDVVDAFMTAQLPIFEMYDELEDNKGIYCHLAIPQCPQF